MSDDINHALTKSNSNLTTTKEADAPFEQHAVVLHQAIEQDRQSIETHLETLQRELEKGMDQVAEVKEKAVEIKKQTQRRIDHVQHKVRELQDWEGIVRKHPWQVVGASFALGFVFGSMLHKD